MLRELAVHIKLTSRQRRRLESKMHNHIVSSGFRIIDIAATDRKTSVLRAVINIVEEGTRTVGLQRCMIIRLMEGILPNSHTVIIGSHHFKTAEFVGSRKNQISVMLKKSRFPRHPQRTADSRHIVMARILHDTNLQIPIDIFNRIVEHIDRNRQLLMLVVVVQISPRSNLRLHFYLIFHHRKTHLKANAVRIVFRIYFQQIVSRKFELHVRIRNSYLIVHIIGQRSLRIVIGIDLRLVETVHILRLHQL